MRNTQQWRSITLQPWCVPLLLLTELALIIAIITLFILSRRRTGFVDVGFEERSVDFSSFQGALEWGQGLLWTTLPVFIIGLYKLFRDAVRTALVVETPYIELAASSPGNAVEARKSVYLDYRTSFAIVAWWKALKNKHYFLSICLVLSFIEALVLLPLTARLFATREELLPKTSSVNVLSVFDKSAALGNADYGALMDTVAASWINESPLPRGTDGDYAFSRITPIQTYENFTISVPTNASRQTVDCEAIPTSSASFNTVDESDDIFTVSFSATDRGCSIEGSIATNSESKDFLEAVLTDECSAAAGRARIIFFYGLLSSTGDLSSSTLVSCIPTYWSASGNLTVVTTNNSFNDRLIESPKFEATKHEAQDLGITAQQIEQGIMNVQTFNPAAAGAGNTNAPLRLAELVVRRIQLLNQTYSAQNIINATQRIYPAIYTMLTLTYFYPELATPMEVSGTLAIPQNRLHVVPPVAITMLVILIILLCSTCYLIFYLHTHPTMLAEEPMGLLGAANLLHGSNIPGIVEKQRRHDYFDGCLSRELSNKTHLDDDLKEAACWIQRGPRPYDVTIMMTEPASLQTMAGGIVGEDRQRLINEEAFKSTDIPRLGTYNREHVVQGQIREQEINYMPVSPPEGRDQFYGWHPGQDAGYQNQTQIRRKPVNSHVVY